MNDGTDKLYPVNKVLPMVKELIADGYCAKDDNPDIDCSVGGQCCRDCWYERLIKVIETGREC